MSEMQNIFDLEAMLAAAPGKADKDNDREPITRGDIKRVLEKLSGITNDGQQVAVIGALRELLTPYTDVR